MARRDKRIRLGRSPDDEEPYYCRICGAGFGEYMACEEVECALEEREDAELRAQRAQKRKAAQ